MASCQKINRNYFSKYNLTNFVHASSALLIPFALILPQISVLAQGQLQLQPGAPSLDFTLNKLRRDVDDLRVDLDVLRFVTVPNLDTRLNETIKAHGNRITLLENSLQKTKGDIDYILLTKIPLIDQGIGSNTANINSLSGTVNGFSSQITELTAEMRHLELTNQVWKKNFKVINNTFVILQRKLGFRLIGPGSGSAVV